MCVQVRPSQSVGGQTMGFISYITPPCAMEACLRASLCFCFSFLAECVLVWLFAFLSGLTAHERSCFRRGPIQQRGEWRFTLGGAEWRAGAVSGVSLFCPLAAPSLILSPRRPPFPARHLACLKNQQWAISKSVSSTRGRSFYQVQKKKKEYISADNSLRY